MVRSRPRSLRGSGGLPGSAGSPPNARKRTAGDLPDDRPPARLADASVAEEDVSLLSGAFSLLAMSTPMRRTRSPCCALAASGQATALPSDEFAPSKAHLLLPLCEGRIARPEPVVLAPKYLPWTLPGREPARRSDRRRKRKWPGRGRAGGRSGADQGVGSGLNALRRALPRNRQLLTIERQGTGPCLGERDPTGAWTGTPRCGGSMIPVRIS
jgi:hypothetical protein